MKNSFLIKGFIFLSLTGFINAAFIDLGTHGDVLPIKEKSLMESLYERYLKYVDVNKLNDDLKDAFERSMVVSSNIGHCKKTLQRVYEPTQIITEDIIVPIANKRLFEKGEQYNVLKENNIFFQNYMLFIDANSKTQLKLANQLKHRALVFVVNGNINNLKPFGIDPQVPFEKDLKEAFKLECTPSIYSQQEFQFNVFEYKTEDLGKEDE